MFDIPAGIVESPNRCPIVNVTKHSVYSDTVGWW